LRRQTKRLIHINEDLLFLERRAKQEPQKVNISELLEDVIEELQPLAHKKAIRINQSIKPDIHKFIAPNDFVRLVKNIIDNALKYSPKNSTVSISQQKVKNTITIVVKDSGIGIPQKDKQSIGDRFFRASNTGEIDGTGLGLAIVKKILNTYGGSIHIDSKQNSGTEVTINLPA
jgi:signal transduction histidine kinase